MSSLFEHLAATDDSHLIAQRVASAVAFKRVRDRFGAFLANATDDLPARLALVEDDITALIGEVVAEHGGDAQKIEAAIKRSMMPGMPGTGMGAPQIPGAPGAGMAQGQETCPKCGGPAPGGQCATCGGAQGGAPGGAPGAPGAPISGGYGLNHTMGQQPSTGPITAAGGFCDNCHAWKSGPKAGCTCDGDGDSDDEAGGEAAEEETKESSVREARRPKMCPYHSEVVDISLGSGDPQAGFNAMSSHAWGDKHCKGGYEGNCNFRPTMVTQSYWDDKQAEYAERRQQRELDQSPVPSAAELSIDTEPIMHAEPLPDEPGKEGVTDIDGELENAPSAIGGGELAMAASTRRSEALKTVDLPTGDATGLGGPSPKIDKSNSGDETGWSLDAIDTQMDGSPNPSIEQDATARADYNKKKFLDQTDAVTKSETLPTNTGDAGYDDARKIKQYPTKTFPKGDQQNPVTQTALSSLPGSEFSLPAGSVGVTAPGPHGLQTPPPPATMQSAPGSPGNMTRPIPQDDLWAMQQQKIDRASAPSSSPPNAWAQYQQSLAENPEIAGYPGAPRRSALDPDKNPIRELMEEYSGFLMPNTVEAAVQDWDVG